MTTSAYAVRARQHWQTHLPNRYRALPAPDVFFSDLGAQIAQRVTEREQVLTANLTLGPSFMENYAALNTAHLQAEEEVLREMLPPPEQDRPAG